jgi:uncharacterized integral membrane protein
MRLKTVVIAVLVLFFGILLAQNTQVVTFQFLFWELSMSRIVVLLLSGLVGFVLAYILRKLK